MVLGMRTVVPVACDSLPLSQTWIKAGRSSLFRQINCMVPTIQDMHRRKGRCIFHWNRSCTLPMTRTHCADAGLPCRPFSILRGDKTSTPPQKHAEFGALLDFVDYVFANRPAGGLVENVFGMANKITANAFVPGQPYAVEMPASWAAWLKAKLESLGYSVICIKLDNTVFCKVPRERIAC